MESKYDKEYLEEVLDSIRNYSQNRIKVKYGKNLKSIKTKKGNNLFDEKVSDSKTTIIDNVPDEILLHLILVGNISDKDLVNLSNTNKRFNQLLTNPMVLDIIIKEARKMFSLFKTPKLILNYLKHNAQKTTTSTLTVRRIYYLTDFNRIGIIEYTHRNTENNEKIKARFLVSRVFALGPIVNQYGENDDNDNSDEEDMNESELENIHIQALRNLQITRDEKAERRKNRKEARMKMVTFDDEFDNVADPFSYKEYEILFDQSSMNEDEFDTQVIECLQEMMAIGTRFGTDVYQKEPDSLIPVGTLETDSVWHYPITHASTKKFYLSNIGLPVTNNVGDEDEEVLKLFLLTEIRTQGASVKNESYLEHPFVKKYLESKKE